LPDLGADKIRAYEFDATNEQPLQLTLPPFIQSIPGSGPRHFIFHPNEKFAYCIEELSGTISSYTYENGKLNTIQRIATHRKKYKQDFSSADIHISPDGKFLYASNRGNENNIAIFSIHENGTLKSVGYQTTFGKTPRNFSIDASGKFLIVANQSTGTVIVFKRNQKNGLLTKTGNEINIENPTCVKIKKILRTLDF
jgi:6-phosphogluconolactonase